MHILLLVLLTAAGFIWWSWDRRRRAGDEESFGPDSLFRRKPCKWQPTGDGKGALLEFRCETCGVSAYSRTGKGPVDCKQNLRGRL